MPPLPPLPSGPVTADGASATQQVLSAFVPDLLATWPEATVWQQLEGTLVSADISGFTALSERLAARGKQGAEELSTLICDCFDGMIDAVDRTRRRHRQVRWRRTRGLVLG